MAKGDVFGPAQRRAANDAQVMSFFGGYERSWRLAKIVMLRSLLKQRAQLQPELQAEFRGGPTCDDNYVFGPITNGLLFSAVAELAMLTEDLFALIKFIRSRERFARSLIHYNAGTVTNLSGTMKSASNERILSAFMIPTMEMFSESAPSIAGAYAEGTALVVRLAHKAAALYEKYAEFHGQYKHGLKVALRPFGGHPLPPEVIARHQDSVSGTLMAYKARAIGKSKRTVEPVLAFMLHAETQPFLAELHDDDNLLRFYGRPRETSIENLIADAYAVTKLVDTIVLNRVDLITPQGKKPDANVFWLPGDIPEKPLALTRVEVTRSSGRWTLDSFREEL